MFEKQRKTVKSILGLIHPFGVSFIVGGIAAIATRNTFAFSKTLNTIAQISGAVSSLAISDKVVKETEENMDNVVDNVFDMFDPSKNEVEQTNFTLIS